MDKRKIRFLETVRIYKDGKLVRKDIDFSVRRELRALEYYDKVLDRKFRAKHLTTQKAIFEAQNQV